MVALNVTSIVDTNVTLIILFKCLYSILINILLVSFDIIHSILQFVGTLSNSTFFNLSGCFSLIFPPYQKTVPLMLKGEVQLHCIEIIYPVGIPLAETVVIIIAFTA